MASVLLTLAVLAAVAYVLVPASAPAPPPTAAAPATSEPDSGNRQIREIPWGDTVLYEPVPAFRIDLAEVRRTDPSSAELVIPTKASRPEIPISWEEAERLRADAKNLPPSPRVQHLGRVSGVSASALEVEPLTDSIDGSEACGPCVNVPPDPEIAAGPNHLVAVVNVAFAVYDKAGTLLTGPIYFRDFFRGVPGCMPRYFDPSVVYDEQADRFVMSIDSAAVGLCVGATATADPTGSWHRYHIQTVGNSAEFFDYPHLGVGREAVFFGATNYVSQISPNGKGRVWAMDKADLYAGAPLRVVSQAFRKVNRDFLPQVMHLHGWAQGTWPTSGPHYVVTSERYDGATAGLWAWDDPFDGEGGSFTKVASIDLNAATGVVAGFPPNFPNPGGFEIFNNDWRPQDVEYRNGHIWIVDGVACNPGSGAVGCGRWARIDPAGPTVVDAGVFGSDGVDRGYFDLAVDDCDNMAIGYSSGSDSTWVGIDVTGRLSSDPPGTVRPEEQVIAGQAVYTSFEAVPPLRWGDFSEMAIDPNGSDFYYFGEYAKDFDFPSANFGTYIAKLTFRCNAR